MRALQETANYRIVLKIRIPLRKSCKCQEFPMVTASFPRVTISKFPSLSPAVIWTSCLLMAAEHWILWFLHLPDTPATHDLKITFVWSITDLQTLLKRPLSHAWNETWPQVSVKSPAEWSGTLFSGIAKCVMCPGFRLGDASSKQTWLCQYWEEKEKKKHWIHGRQHCSLTID